MNFAIRLVMQQMVISRLAQYSACHMVENWAIYYPQSFQVMARDTLVSAALSASKNQSVRSASDLVIEMRLRVVTVCLFLAGSLWGGATRSTMSVYMQE